MFYFGSHAPSCLLMAVAAVLLLVLSLICYAILAGYLYLWRDRAKARSRWSAKRCSTAEIWRYRTWRRTTKAATSASLQTSSRASFSQHCCLSKVDITHPQSSVGFTDRLFVCLFVSNWKALSTNEAENNKVKNGQLEGHRWWHNSAYLHYLAPVNLTKFRARNYNADKSDQLNV